MKVIKWETLYHEDHGATLKHKCGKRIVALSLLSFSLIFLFGPFLFFMASFFVWTLIPTCGGNHSLHHPFLTWDNALIMMIITLLFTYNSRITTRHLEQDMTLCECLPRCTGICNESRVTCIKIMLGGFATNTMLTTGSCNGNMTKVKYVMMMINRTVESCMTIYLGMAMEMP